MTGSAKPPRDLRGRTVLVTGASAGLGTHISRRLHEVGARLVLSGRREVDLRQLADELPPARVVVADLATEAGLDAVAAASQDVEVAVLNAAVPAAGPLLEFSAEHLERALDVNLLAPIRLCSLLLPAMLERGSGHIVLIASLAGRVASPGSSIYNATKFGLRGFGHALRSELSGSGVQVSLVSPTYVSEAGMWHDTGLAAPTGEVSPRQVADAVLRCIKQGRAEVMVAPLGARFGARLLSAYPELLHSLFKGVGAMPEEGVRRQQEKW